MKFRVFFTLCCILRIGTGAILTEEMSMFNNRILKNIKANGLKNFLNVQTKDNVAPENGNVAEKVMKDIDYLLSSLQLGEYDDSDDDSYNTSVGSTCNWSGNSFKCCQAFDLTGTTCLFAKFVDDDINVFVQIGGQMVWVKTMSYKNTFESMFRDISKLMSGNAHFDEDEVTVDKIFVDESRLSDDVSTNACNWKQKTVTCCKSIRLLGRKISFCIEIKIVNSSSAEFTFKVGKYTIWRGKTNMCTKKLQACYNITPLKFCLTIKDFHLSKRRIGACIYVDAYLLWFHEGLKLFCLNKWFK